MSSSRGHNCSDLAEFPGWIRFVLRLETDTSILSKPIEKWSLGWKAFRDHLSGESANSNWTIFGYLEDMFLRTRNSVHSSKDYRIQDYITNWCFI